MLQSSLDCQFLLDHFHLLRVLGDNLNGSLDAGLSMFSEADT